MNINKLAGSKVQFEVVIPVETFKACIDKAFEKKIKEVEIKGFRKGQAPRAVYEAQYGRSSLYPEALNEAINETYFQAVVENKIDICGYPQIDLADENNLNETDPIHYFATVSVYPEVTLGEYTNLGIEKAKVSVLAKEVEAKINAELDKDAMLVTKADDAVVENGDTVIFDFEGFKDGVPFEGGAAKDYTLEIGSGNFIPGFEEGMIGLKKGESKDLNLKFPEEYQAKDLAGQEVVFKVEVHEIKGKEAQELNDEWVQETKAAKENSEIKTVEDYKKYVKEQIKAQKEESATAEARQKLFDALVKNSTFELPEDLVQEETDYAFQNAEAQAKQYNLPLELLLQYTGGGTVEQYKEQLYNQAKNTLSLRFVLKAIANKENFEVTQEDYEKKYEEIAKQYNMKVEEVKERVSESAAKEEIMTQKAYDFVEAKNPFVAPSKAKKSE